MRSTLIPLFACLALALPACQVDDSGDTSKPSSVVTPSLGSGKTDVSDGVKQLGVLNFDASAEGAFTKDFQFFGYMLEGHRSDSEVTIEVTRAGSDDDLDSTLFVYGLTAQGDWEDVAVDDDGGWKALSKVEAVPLTDEYSEYMVVLGTADARGRGEYTLKTTCTAGQCGKLQNADQCDWFTLKDVSACISDQLSINYGVDQYERKCYEGVNSKCEVFLQTQQIGVSSMREVIYATLNYEPRDEDYGGGEPRVRGVAYRPISEALSRDDLILFGKKISSHTQGPEAQQLMYEWQDRDVDFSALYEGHQDSVAYVLEQGRTYEIDAYEARGTRLSPEGTHHRSVRIYHNRQRDMMLIISSDWIE